MQPESINLKANEQQQSLSKTNNTKSRVATNSDLKNSLQDHKHPQKESKATKILDEILLEDQEDLDQQQTELNELYKIISDKGKNPQEISDALVQIQKISSGGNNPNGQKGFKQIGIKQFEKNLQQNIEKEREA